MGNLISQLNLVTHKKQIEVLCHDHCRAFSRPNAVKSPSGALSYIQKLYGLNSSDIN